MISTIVSRLVILVFGTLYPAYASYKAVRTKNVKEYVKWMMYWIVFALFTCVETFTDVFFSFWFPFYYEIKIVLVVWLLSPATKGSSILYRKFVHPMLSKREQEIDEYISRAKEQGYHTVLNLGSKGVTYATNVIMQTAIKGGGGIVNHLRRSYSLSDLTSDTDLMGDVNRNSKSLLDEGMDTGDSPRELRQRVARKATGSHVDLYFPEMDVDLRTHSHNSRELPISLSQIRSTEDISSGYSSADPLYGNELVQGTVGESVAPLVRTASVGATRARARGGRGSVRKATAESTDNEDDFLIEDWGRRPSHNPCTTYPFFALYPELLSMFPSNNPNFLPPEVLENILLKKINSKMVWIKEESNSLRSNQRNECEEGEIIVGNEQHNLGGKGENKIGGVGGSPGSNLIEEKSINSENSYETFVSEKQPSDIKSASEVKTENNVENFNDKTPKSGFSEAYSADKIANSKSNINKNKSDEMFGKTIDSKVLIKENENSDCNSDGDCNFNNTTNSVVTPKSGNSKRDDNSLLNSVNANHSDKSLLVPKNDDSLIKETDDSDEDVFLDVDSDMVQQTAHYFDESTLNNNKNINYISPIEEGNITVYQEIVESLEPIIDICTEQLVLTEHSKYASINSTEIHLNNSGVNPQNLEVSDIESVGSLTDDYSQADETIPDRKAEDDRKGKYGKRKAPLPPQNLIKGEIIQLPVEQSDSLPCQSKVIDTSSKVGDCVNNKKAIGAPDIISQLGERSKPTVEKLKYDFLNEKKDSLLTSSYNDNKRSVIQHNVDTKKKSDIASVSSVVFKEDENNDGNGELGKLKNKQRPEPSGMSRFFPKNNIPMLFGIFSQKDGNTNSTSGDVIKMSTDQTEKDGKHRDIEEIVLIPEQNISVRSKQKLQANEKTVENVLSDNNCEDLLDKDVVKELGTNKASVKVREMSQSPSSRRKHYAYK